MEIKHSGFGIGSLVTSIISGIVLISVFAYAGVLEISTPGGIDDESVEVVLIGLAVILFFLISLVAFGLGVAGLFQKECKKVFAIIGTLIAATMITLTIGIMLLGVYAQ